MHNTHDNLIHTMTKTKPKRDVRVVFGHMRGGGVARKKPQESGKESKKTKGKYTRGES